MFQLDQIRQAKLFVSLHAQLLLLSQRASLSSRVDPEIPVAVRRCAAAPRDLFQSISSEPEPHQRAESYLEALVVHRLLERHRPRAGRAPLLEYVPLRCLGKTEPAAGQAALPQFSVRSTYFGKGGSHDLHASSLCQQQGWSRPPAIAPGSAAGGPMWWWTGPPIALLWLDGPSYAPTWKAPDRPLTYLDVSRSPAAGLPFSVPWVPRAASEPLRIFQTPAVSIGWPPWVP